VGSGGHASARLSVQPYDGDCNVGDDEGKSVTRVSDVWILGSYAAGSWNIGNTNGQCGAWGVSAYGLTSLVNRVRSMPRHLVG